MTLIRNPLPYANLDGMGWKFQKVTNPKEWLSCPICKLKPKIALTKHDYTFADYGVAACGCIEEERNVQTRWTNKDKQPLIRLFYFAKTEYRIYNSEYDLQKMWNKLIEELVGVGVPKLIKTDIMNDWDKDLYGRCY